MSDAFCLFENGKSYTALQVARLLGRHGKADNMTRWVRENIFDQGCAFRRIGNTCVTTGDLLNLWIARGAEGVERKGD